MPRRFRLDAGLPPDAASLLRSLLTSGDWTEATGADTDLFWTPARPRPQDFQRARDGRVQLNHFADDEALSEKHRLRAHADAARARAERVGIPDLPGFFPGTYSMAAEIDALDLAASYAPRQRWIRRPKVMSPAQHASVLSSLDRADADNRWLVQRYIARPDLLDGRKYTLRLYVLVATLDPLQVYVHRHLLVMRAAAPWTDDDADCSGTVHLTSIADATAAPVWRQHAERFGGGSDRLLARCGIMLAATIADAREAMLASDEAPATRGSFALLEADVLIDADGLPWLLELSTWPATHGSPVDATVLEDAMRLTGVIEGGAGASNGFHRLLPSSDADALAACASLRRHDVEAIREFCGASGVSFPALVPAAVHHAFLDDGLVLYSERDRQVYVLNPTGAFVWLRCSERTTLPDIAGELAKLFPDQAERAELDVWATALEWLRLGLLVPEHRPAALLPSTQPVHRERFLWNAATRIYQVGDWRACVRYPAPDVESWVHATLNHLEAPDATEYDCAIEIAAQARGYDLRIDGATVAQELWSAHLPAAVHHHIREQAQRAGGALLGLHASIVARNGCSVLLLGGALEQTPALRDALQRLDLAFETRAALLFRRNPVRVVGGRNGALDLAVRHIVVEEVAVTGASELLPLSRADALRRLLVEDPEMISTLDPDGVRALTRFVGTLGCHRLVAASPDAGASLLAGLLNGNVTRDD